ncbi:MAG: hypothetical protein ABIG71_03110 [Candidatus Uhrbacteria bacterium]
MPTNQDEFPFAGETEEQAPFPTDADAPQEEEMEQPTSPVSRRRAAASRKSFRELAIDAGRYIASGGKERLSLPVEGMNPLIDQYEWTRWLQRNKPNGMEASEFGQWLERSTPQGMTMKAFAYALLRSKPDGWDIRDYAEWLELQEGEVSEEDVSS